MEVKSWWGGRGGHPVAEFGAGATPKQPPNSQLLEYFSIRLERSEGNNPNSGF